MTTASPNTPATPLRTATIDRRTRETAIAGSLTLDGRGDADVRTGIGFLDHMLTTLALHARLDLTIACEGDLHVDDHHTAEDCALAIGAAIDTALADRAGIARFATAFAPMDEALARVVIDVSGRPAACVDLGTMRDSVGGLACENAAHVFVSLATAMRAAVHVDVLRGDNDHHRIEAAFKAFALALRSAVCIDDAAAGVPSAKGVL
jgi:imidazoleglycerol phosphate dehydratase HisB